MLKSTEQRFSSRVNIHIVQCDSQVQSVTKITNETEMKELLDHFESTFRARISGPCSNSGRAVEQKEFKNLKGMIYFTTRRGLPQKKPAINGFRVPQRDYRDSGALWASRRY
jgi:hypothetical protein